MIYIRPSVNEGGEMFNRAMPIVAILALVTVALPTTARASLYNGDFEAGTLDGWTDVPFSTGVNSISSNAYSGTYGLEMGLDLYGTGIYNDFSVISGRTYQFSFWMAADVFDFDNYGGANVSVSLGNTQFNFFDLNSQLYKKYSVSYTALTNMDGISIFVSNPYGFVSFDDFTLVADVPEPASWTMMIMGFGLAGTLLRQRRRISDAERC